MKISGSILSSTISPKDAIKLYDKTSIDYIHIDVMDGKFVENKTYTIGDITKFSMLTSKPFDVHLMVNNPIKYIDELSMLNTEYITFHYEAVKDSIEVINKIKDNGLRVGIAIKPNTKVEDILELLPMLDLVLVMTVEPGASGQTFMESMVYKIEVLRKIIDEKGYKTLINVDGGVNENNIDCLKQSGADMLVSASYLLSGDTENKIRSMR